jgi:hypothetical protein
MLLSPPRDGSHDSLMHFRESTTYSSFFLAFPMDSQVISSWFYFDCTSVVSLTLHFIHHQFYHLQSSFHSFTSYKNPPMGPPPSTSSPCNLHPHRPIHIAPGHPFLYLYTHPKLFFIYLVIIQKPSFPAFT